MSQSVSEICPISQTRFEDPVKNKVCGHSYSKKSIMDLLSKNNSNRKPTRCPVIGCSKNVESKNLESNKELIRYLKRTERRNKINPPIQNSVNVDDDNEEEIV